MLTGFLATFLLPETNGRTLEDLSNEEQEDFIHSSSSIDSHKSIAV
jgi:PHS family inorganic phosphate transporter-like MFS transporter